MSQLTRKANWGTQSRLSASMVDCNMNLLIKTTLCPHRKDPKTYQLSSICQETWRFERKKVEGVGRSWSTMSYGGRCRARIRPDASAKPAGDSLQPQLGLPISCRQLVATWSHATLTLVKRMYIPTNSFQQAEGEAWDIRMKHTMVTAHNKSNGSS